MGNLLNLLEKFISPVREREIITGTSTLVGGNFSTFWEITGKKVPQRRISRLQKSIVKHNYSLFIEEIENDRVPKKITASCSIIKTYVYGFEFMVDYHLDVSLEYGEASRI
jgi:hypothetical protein|tara:strand:- start:221 stop:553 length:333 start_codon:yes stop_codon:yes gene_type:complete